MELTELAKAGIAGVSIVALVLLYLVVRMGFNLLQSSNKVVQANTEAINQLNSTLERSSILEEQFREDILEISKGTNKTVNEIKSKVNTIHAKVVG